MIDFQGKLVGMVHGPLWCWRPPAVSCGWRISSRCPWCSREQSPKGIGPTEESIRTTYDALTTPKFFLEKTAFGCCGDAGFEALLQQARPGLAPAKRQIVVAGIEAHVCVMQTVLELLASGHEVHLAGTPSAAGARNTRARPGPHGRRRRHAHQP